MLGYILNQADKLIHIGALSHNNHNPKMIESIQELSSSCRKDSSCMYCSLNGNRILGGKSLGFKNWRDLQLRFDCFERQGGIKKTGFGPPQSV
jgi:hypothetical protein